MPCDLGYKSFTRVTVPVPKPLAFKKRVQAPKADAELMERIGQDDPAFVEWMNELDTVPLLEKALAEALAASDDVSPLAFSVDADGLTAEGDVRGSAGKADAERIADQVGRRWQAEVMAIVAQLLDYETQVTATADGAIMVEGERHGSEQVNEYLRVTLDPKRGSSVLFEHFSSKKRLDAVKSKFLALARKFGIPIDIRDAKESGSPIPAGVEHKHFLKRDK